MKKFVERTILVSAMVVGLSVAGFGQKGPKKPPPKDPPPVVTPQPKLPPKDGPKDGNKPKKPSAEIIFVGREE